MSLQISLIARRNKIAKRFKANFLEEYNPSYRLNGLKNDKLQIITVENTEQIVPAIWGLVPEDEFADRTRFFEKYGSIDEYLKINKTLQSMGEYMMYCDSYSTAAKSRRCLIIADGFYEEHQSMKSSIPVYCYIPNKNGAGKLFAIAGIYSRIGENQYTCSMVTVGANYFFSIVVNLAKRMPLVLDKRLEKGWLDESLNKIEILDYINEGFTDQEFRVYPVAKGSFDNETAIMPTIYDGFDDFI